MNIENKETVYNHLSNIALINLYTLSKDSKQIRLKDFSFNNKNHLFLLNIAKSLHNLFEHEIFVDVNFFDFIKYKIKHRKENFIHRSKDVSSPLIVDDFLNHITSAQEVEDNIWEKMYDDFFGEK